MSLTIQMTIEEKRAIAKEIVKLRKLIEKIDKILAPYRRNDTPYDNIYRWYADNGKIGQLLRRKDDLIGKKHELEVKLGIWSI